jgi:glucan-binding YG repeat protein
LERETIRTILKKKSAKKETEKLIRKMERKNFLDPKKDKNKLQYKLEKDLDQYLQPDEYNQRIVPEEVTKNSFPPPLIAYPVKPSGRANLEQSQKSKSQNSLLLENASIVTGLKTRNGKQIYTTPDKKFFYVAQNKSRRNHRRVTWFPPNAEII